jgi:hypothetical protein
MYSSANWCYMLKLRDVPQRMPCGRFCLYETSLIRFFIMKSITPALGSSSEHELTRVKTSEHDRTRANENAKKESNVAQSVSETRRSTLFHLTLCALVCSLEKGFNNRNYLRCFYVPFRAIKHDFFTVLAI